MGFNKKNIDKNYILNYLKKNKKDVNSALRNIVIESIFKSEILVMDQWSSNFYNDLNPNERLEREKIISNQDANFVSFFSDSELDSFSSLSETLISLIINPLWMDIHLTTNRFNIKVTTEESGKFQILRNKCIDSIINHFDKNY